MHYCNQLHDGVACRLINKPGHRCVFEIGQLVTQVYVLNNRLVIDCDSLLELNDILQELSITTFFLNICDLLCLEVVEFSAEASD